MRAAAFRNSLVTATAIILVHTISPVSAQETIETEAGPVRMETVVGGLNHPWGIAALPDGGFLVTERDAGQLRRLSPDGELSEPLSGTPEVFAEGQGGLLDVALDPDFASNNFVYLSFAEPGPRGAATAVGRGKLTDGGVEGFEIIFSQWPKVPGDKHFGGRIAFSPDGYLFLALGERYKFDPAQDNTNHLGTIVRIQRDGRTPEDNPFVQSREALGEIWSYGHRNVQATAFDPDTGRFWIAEMGPRGGDELNLPEAGRNYGWPVVSWGEHYSGEDIPDPPGNPQFVEPVRHWTPVISPSGMLFYTGDAFPEWQGSMMIGSLSDQSIVRLDIDGASVAGEERIPIGARVRDLEQGPDGNLYVITDQGDGKVWRLSPAS